MVTMLSKPRLRLIKSFLRMNSCAFLKSACLRRGKRSPCITIGGQASFWIGIRAVVRRISDIVGATGASGTSHLEKSPGIRVFGELDG